MLVHQLCESFGYLSDAGWEQTARLMLLAADEIERLTAQLTANRPQPPLADEPHHRKLA